MEWLIGLSATALGGLIAAGSSWLSARYQAKGARDRWKDESAERHEDKVREALADVLAHRESVVILLSGMLKVKMEDRAEVITNDVVIHLSERHRSQISAIVAGVQPVATALERVRLLTKSEAIVRAAANLDRELADAIVGASVLATEKQHVLDYQSRRDAVKEAFKRLSAVARDECARPRSTTAKTTATQTGHTGNDLAPASERPTS